MAGRVELKTGGRVGEGWRLIKAQLDQQCGGEVQGLGRVQSSSLRVGLCASRAILQKIEERKNSKNIDSILKNIEYSPASFCSSIFLSLTKIQPIIFELHHKKKPLQALYLLHLFLPSNL